MRIYTKTGDGGETGLFGGERVLKSARRVCAYGEVDEANSYLGVVRSACKGGSAFHAELDAMLALIQADLFVCGADLATPPRPVEHQRTQRLSAEESTRLEREIDRMEAGLPELQSFILPAGDAIATGLLYARTLVRRAERSVVELMQHEAISTHIVIYLNRLSDLLFVLGRTANHRAGVAEEPWRARLP